MKNHKRPDEGSFKYKLILGLLIFFTLIGIIGLVYSAKNYSTSQGFLWVTALWTIFYAATAYSWTDEERYEKYEYILTPVIFGAVFLLLAAFMVCAFIIFVPKIASGEELAVNILAFAIAEASCGLFVFITYKYFLAEYFAKKSGDSDD